MAGDPLPAELAWAQHLDRRIGAVLESVPGFADLRPGSALGTRFSEGQLPSWMRIPIWLDDSWADARAGSLPDGDLAEVLWGQYALFVFFRLQDDVLDREQNDLRLIIVADRFLLESLESFQRLRGLDNGFWTFYRRRLRDTVDGALEVGRLEKEPGMFRAEHLQLHSRVTGAFKVGAAVVCQLHGHDQDAEWLSRLQDQLAIIGQIVDDLKDLGEDLKGGRYTWVGNTMLAVEPGELITPEERASRLGAGLLRPERGAIIVEELRRAIRAAAAEIPASAPRQIHDFVHGLSATTAELEQRMHEARVRCVFGDALTRGSEP